MKIIRIALIKNEEIITVSLQDADLPYPPGNWILEDEAIANGYKYKIQNINVPDEIPLWAFRSILKINGVSDQIPELINLLPEPDKTISLEQWERANFINRNHPVIQSIGSALGMTSEEIDNIFISGYNLTQTT